MAPLAGKVAVVTGSTGGLGRAIATGLAQAGCHVVLNGIEPAERGAEICRQLEDAHRIEALYHRADLADADEVAGLMAAAARRFGRVDILTNNAVVRHFAPVEDFPVARWNEALAVNVSAAFHTIRLALPGMRARGFGRIVNLSSVYGSRAVANRIDYVTTKSALIGMTRAVALENLDHDITCNAVCPGSVHTPYSEARIEGMMHDEDLPREAAVRKFLAGKQPSGRFIAPEGVVDLIVFLCRPAARDITGAVLPVDAGWTAS